MSRHHPGLRGLSGRYGLYHLLRVCPGNIDMIPIVLDRESAQISLRPVANTAATRSLPSSSLFPSDGLPD